MKILIIFTAIMTVMETYRLSIYFLRKDISLVRKIFEILILILMICLCYLNLEYLGGWIVIYLSVISDGYIFLMIVNDFVRKKDYVSVLSVKEGIDMASLGIMFLDKYGKIILINNRMSEVLKKLNIRDNYIDELRENSFRKIDDSYLIKCDQDVWQLKDDNRQEVTLTNVTDLYRLQEEIELQNKMIDDNNKKMIETISNMEEIERGKNLLKIKNEYHDILGHRLALLTKYLECDDRNVKDIEFLLNSIYDKGNEKKNSKDMLDSLVRMYNIIGIKILVKGNIPSNEEIGRVFFEIIREAVTNAIIHADSKNILIDIKEYLDRIEMVISNDGSISSKDIYENEGIKGMRRKLSDIGGSLTILVNDKFTLKIAV